MGGPQYLTHKNSKYTQLCTLKYDCEHSIIPLNVQQKIIQTYTISTIYSAEFFLFLLTSIIMNSALWAVLSFEP